MDALKNLRDIHLPDPISWWPPAPGWWLGLALAAALAGCLYWLLKRRSDPLARAAMLELADIRRRFEAGADHGRLLGDLSALLRRVAIKRLAGQPPTAIVDQRWVALLASVLPPEEHNGDADFALFATGPYQPQPKFDAHATLDLAARWIRASRRLTTQG